ncbi:hypothetical protein HYT18_04135 [Candidatus Microgenomates bacterium]|nr:hypothetical protein [Candidatus Microgenomates bacterium]
MLEKTILSILSIVAQYLFPSLTNLQALFYCRFIMDFSSFDSDKLFSKKNLITYLILAIIILAIPIGVRLVQQQTQLKSLAAESKIEFSGDGVTCDPSVPSSAIACTTTESTITIELTSPFGLTGESQTD